MLSKDVFFQRGWKAQEGRAISDSALHIHALLFLFLSGCAFQTCLGLSGDVAPSKSEADLSVKTCLRLYGAGTMSNTV